MEKLNKENENLDEEVDFEFFDDKKSETSNSNNNALVKSSSLKSKSKDVKFPEAEVDKTRPESELSESSSDSSSDDDNSLADVNSVDSSSSSSSSKNSRTYSEDFSKSASSKSKTRKQSTQSLSRKHDSTRLQDSSIENSSDESDVTNVSSLESENLSEAIKPPKAPPKTPINSYSRISKYHTHLGTSDDMDMLPTDVILQAMMRIHEERRLVQKMKPDWVDPNTKDYSVTGISHKLNLVPERLVSMPKRNIRSNPFYFHSADLNKRLYHTAINRNRERDRIDKQNKEIVYRLQNIRPSPGITKDELLREYSRLNRFSNQNNRVFRAPLSSASSCAQSPANSNKGAKIRRTNSSTLVSRLAESRQSNSRHSDSKRVMSANSLSGPFSTRPSTAMNSIKKRK